MRIYAVRPARSRGLLEKWNADRVLVGPGYTKPAKFTLKPARLAMPIHRKKSDRFQYYRCIAPVLERRSDESARYLGLYRLHASESIAADAKKPPVLCAWHRTGGIARDSKELTPINRCAVRSLRDE